MHSQSYVRTEYHGHVQISESCCSWNETLCSKWRFSDTFSLRWCPETNENEHWCTSWGSHRWLLAHWWRQVTIWNLNQWNMMRVAQQKAPEGHVWVQGRQTKKQVTTRPGNIWAENGQTCEKALSAKLKINGLKKIPKWTLRGNSGAFTVFRTIVNLKNKKQCQKLIGNEEGFNEALQSHHTSPPERFKLAATPCKWMVWQKNEQTEFFMIKARSREHDRWIETNSNHKEYRKDS